MKTCVACGRRCADQDEYEVPATFCRVCSQDSHLAIAYLAARVAKLEAGR